MNKEMDPTDLNALEAAQQEDQRKIKSDRDLEVDDLKWLMSNKRGRRIVARLLDEAGVWRISFNTNALQMAFNEGHRNNGLRLMNVLMEHCPDRFMDMIKERNNG